MEEVDKVTFLPIGLDYQARAACSRDGLVMMRQASSLRTCKILPPCTRN
jgi:hypothetical protein